MIHIEEILYPIVLGSLIAIGCGILIVFSKVRDKVIDEKKQSEGSCVGGILSIIVVIAAFAALCYFMNIFD